MAASLVMPALSVLLFLFCVYPLAVRWLKRIGLCRKNYRGVEIPAGVGIIIPFSQWIVFPWVHGENQMSIHFLQSGVLFSMAFAGWLDDRYGGNEAKGLKGHVALYLREKRISTGLWKALVGCGLAAVVSAIHSGSNFAFFLHFLIIVMMTNLINLLDLRPGRAIKGFFLLFIPFLLLTYPFIPPLLWLPIVLAAGFLLVDDLAGRTMLGDAGANVLGIALGFWTVLYAPMEWKWSMAGGAAMIHLYAEKKSITALIQRIPFLYWIDRLGRREV